MPIAILVVVVLVALELVSQVLSSRHFSNLAKQFRDLYRFKYPWDVAVLLLWLILAFLSVWYYRNTSAISYTFLSVGTVAFLLGWLVRYQPFIVGFLSRRFTRIRPFLRGYSSSWNRLELSTIRVRFLWPWLEIIGISLVSKALSFFPAFLIFPIILGVSIVQKGQRLAATNPGISPPKLEDVWPMPRHILLSALIPITIGILVGIATREFPIFYGDTTTAKSLLFTLSQIEGSIGILAITIIFVLTQLTASNYSVRVSRILFRQPAFSIALLILLISVSYNLLVVARSPIMFPADTAYFRSVIVDLSFILALATACGITYFIYSAPRMVSPESIIAHALRSFDGNWLDAVKRDWRRPDFEIRLNVRDDPFIVIERVLSKAIDSGDSLTFVSGLVLIRDHLYELGSVEPTKLADSMIEIDAYFRHHCRSLIRRAASNSDAYTLLQFIYFIEALEKPSPRSIAEADTFAFGFTGAAGELLVREIVEQSVEHRLIECATRGIHIIETRAADVIKTLPKQEDAWLFDSMKQNVKTSEEEKKRLWKNDYKVNNFERQYFSYLQSLGVIAANSKLAEIVRSVAWSLNNIISDIIQYVNGHTMKAMIVRQGLTNLDEVRKASCDNRLSDAISLSMLEYALEHTDPQHDEMVAWHIIWYVSNHLVSHAKLGLLNYMDVVDSAMCGIATVKKYTKPAIRLLEAYGEAAKLVKKNANYAENRDLQLVYGEIVQRIRQIGHNVPKKEPAEILAVTKQTLDALGEPEFEAKSNP